MLHLSLRPVVLLLILLTVLSCSKKKEEDALGSGGNYPGHTIIESDITTNTRWTADKKYVLIGLINVKSGATLTIEPGTIIKGDKETKGSLVIDRGGKIMAVGTKDKPIVFTSAQPKGSRKPGDWGGLILCGRAPINLPAREGQIEGGSGVIYGGSDVNDSSGELRYVRIEYAGVPYIQDNEINGLTLGGVGKETVLDHIQVSFANDDSYEFFGGNVNARYLVAYNGLDDDFDTDNGYSGNIQYALSIRTPNLFDAAGSSNGFETDNDKDGSNNEPFTTAAISNVTLIGPIGFTDSPNAKFDAGAYIRRNSRFSIYNGLIVGWPRGVVIDGDKTATAATDNKMQIRNTAVVNCKTPLATAKLTAGNSFNIQTWFNTAAFGNRVITDVNEVKFSSPYNTARPNYTLTAGSSFLAGADFSAEKLSSSDFFNKTTTFIGAFGSEDWTASWTNWDPQNTDY